MFVDTGAMERSGMATGGPCRIATGRTRTSGGKAKSGGPKAMPLRREAVGALEARLGGRLQHVPPFAFGPLTLSRARLAERPAVAGTDLVVHAIEGPWREARLAASPNLIAALAAPPNGGALPGPVAAALLVELALEDGMVALERETGPLRLVPLATAAKRRRMSDARAVRLDALLESEAGRIAGEVTLWGCEAFEVHLAEALAVRAVRPTPPALTDLVLPARVRVAGVSLTLRELRDLEPGDVVLADGCEAAASGAAALAMLAGRPVARAHALVLCAGLAIDLRVGAADGSDADASSRGVGGEDGGRVVSWRKEHAMSNVSPPDRPAPDLPAIGVDSVEVVLDVEFAREGLTLEELCALQPGSILTFAQSADAPLMVRINGRPFAHCEAVSVGERAGVRIVSLLAPPEELAPAASEGADEVPADGGEA